MRKRTLANLSKLPDHAIDGLQVLLKARGELDASRPRLMEFCDRIHSRLAYQQALKRDS